MIPCLFFTLFVAGLDWIAVSKSWKQVEYFTKPFVMLLLISVLVLVGGVTAVPLFWFWLGVLFSLAGDVFLMLSERWFISGLAAFLLAHVMYIVGFILPFPKILPVWVLGIAVIIGFFAVRILRRIVSGLFAKDMKKLVAPVILYGFVITLMLLTATSTLFRMEWKTIASILVSLGALLFYVSDIILAWSKFVTPIKKGRLINIVTYHLGQITLITGIIMQFIN